MKTLYVRGRKQWRAWLAKNCQDAKEVWLIYPKKDSGQRRVAYSDAVEEALCFGWIDGKTRKLDADRYAQRFTPRKPTSRWSAINIARARKLIAAGKMTTAGKEAFRPERKSQAHPTELPKNLEATFKKHAAAWENFQCFPPYYRRMTIAWVASAKKEDTRVTRLNKLLEFSSRNARIRFM